MAHQPSLSPDPQLRPQPVERPIAAAIKQFARVKDDSDHLAELTATLAANGGGDSAPDLALDLVLNEIVEQARLNTSASGAAVALERNGEMVWRASSGDSAPELGVTVSTDTGLAGECLRTLRVQCCDDSDLDVRVDAAACRLLGVRSIVMVPIFERDRVFGLFEALSPQASAFGAREIQSLQTLTRRIVDNVKHVEAVRDESAKAPADNPVTDAAEIPVLNFDAVPEKPRRWFKLDLLTGVLTGVVILLAGLLGWMVGRAGWDMAVRSSDAQLTASTVQQATEERTEEPTEPPAPKPQKIERKQKKAEPTAVVPTPATPETMVPAAEAASQTADPVPPQQTPPPAPKPESTESHKNAAPVEPPIGGLIVYEKGKVVFRSPAPKQKQVSSDAGDNTLLHRVEPEYPEQALQSGVEGPVVLKVLVGTDGAVEDVHTISGDSLLASAAEYAVRQWRFRPYIANGHPAEFETRVTVNFAHP